MTEPDSDGLYWVLAGGEVEPMLWSHKGLLRGREGFWTQLGDSRPWTHTEMAESYEDFEVLEKVQVPSGLSLKGAFRNG